jgi:pilus assembly protein Flp/PilA
MEKLKEGIARFMRDEEGVTAIEYGLIAALIAVVIIASVELVGTNLQGVFDTIASSLNPLGSGPTPPPATP